MTNKLTGRPARNRGLNKTYRVTARLTTSEYYSFLSRLRSSNRTKSDFIRLCISDSEVKERLTVEHLALIRKLSGMANNLNQLAHQANAQGYSTVQNEIKALCDGIDNVIHQIKT